MTFLPPVKMASQIWRVRTRRSQLGGVGVEHNGKTQRDRWPWAQNKETPHEKHAPVKAGVLIFQGFHFEGSWCDQHVSHSAQFAQETQETRQAA